MARLPWMISLIRRGGTEMFFARRSSLIPWASRTLRPRSRPDEPDPTALPPFLDSLVVVCDLDVVGVASLPPEADPSLVVDADAVLTLSVARELLETIARGNPHILQ